MKMGNVYMEVMGNRVAITIQVSKGFCLLVRCNHLFYDSVIEYLSGLDMLLWNYLQKVISQQLKVQTFHEITSWLFVWFRGICFQCLFLLQMGSVPGDQNKRWWLRPWTDTGLILAPKSTHSVNPYDLFSAYFIWKAITGEKKKPFKDEFWEHAVE